MTPTSVYRESTTDVCREKHLLEQNERLNRMLAEVIDYIGEEVSVVSAEQLRAQQEMINNG